jgi:UDP-N-acetyl-D-glucosamine dehydrogenase
MSEHFERAMDRIVAKNAHVGILGLGYVGLPLARAFAESEFLVLGFDTDRSKIERLNRGQSYIGRVSDEAVRAMRKAGFVATDDFKELRQVDAVLICVPTPLTEERQPDLSFVIQSAEEVARSLRPGMLVVLESTSYPGTTRQVVQPILAKTGLAPGRDFFLASSPEREDPGNSVFTTRNIPKVVGGIDPESLEATAALYAHITPEVVKVSSAEVAEACKILENTFRAVNIALVNELKVLFERMGISIWEVIDAAKTKPFGFQAFYPGPGLGGHCIPIDPLYLTWVAKRYGLNTRFIELAGEINTSMPAYVVNQVADALNERRKPVRGSKIALLGMAYKKDVEDPRESPGFALMDLLLKKGALVEFNDPFIPELPCMRRYPHLHGASQVLTPEFLQSQDCVLIVTDHSAYDWPWIVSHASLIVDTRNATRAVVAGRERIVRA